MKRRLAKVGLVILLIGLILTGCRSTEEPINGDTDKWEWPKQVTLGTLATGSSNQVSTAGWANQLEATTGMRVRVMSEHNYPLAGRWLKDGTIASHVVTPSGFIEKLTANAGYATRDGGPNPDVRMLWLSQISYSHYMVRADSNIHTPYDLKGVRFAYPEGFYSVERIGGALLHWGNLTTNDVQMVPFSDWNSHIRGFMEGRADITMANPASPLAIEAEGLPGGVRWLDLDPSKDPEGAKRFWELIPERHFAEVSYGAETARGTHAVTSPFHIYVTTKTINEEFGYHLAKWLHENFDSYESAHEANNTMHIDIFVGTIKDSLIPVHEGTIKYLKEMGKWNDDLQSHTDNNLELLNIYHEAYQEAIALADEKGVRVDPDNAEWTKLWSDFQKEKNIVDLWKEYL